MPTPAATISRSRAISAWASASVAERTATYHASQALLAEQAPALFLFWEEAFPAVAARLRGPRPNPHTGLLWNAGEWWLG